MASDDEGASPKEQLIEAARRDNVELFHEVTDKLKKSMPKEQLATFLNDIKDSWGNYLLHLAASFGSYDVLDALLDVEHLECDPLTIRDSSTPLHTCVQYAKERDAPLGTEMARMCCDAGCDPRVRDKYSRKPIDLVNEKEGSLKDLWNVLRMEEYKLTEMAGMQTVVDDEDEGGSDGPSDED
ncbi:MAG: hypothetical protein Q9160_008103 [Pyrenula sp. 1 TL-2023]